MKTLFNNRTKLILIALLFLGGTMSANAQTKYSVRSMDVKLEGTSTLHDWTMTASSGNSEGIFSFAGNDKLTSISGLSFSLPAKSLKSEHKAMDNNTYKALKADENPNISFVMTSGKISQLDATTYQLTCIGKLTI